MSGGEFDIVSEQIKITSSDTASAPGVSSPLIRRGWLAVMLGALSALAPLSIDMYLPALPTLARDFHTSTSLAQLSLTCCFLGLALGQLLAGPISDARGRRAPLMLGMAVYTGATFLCAFTPSIWFLIALRLLQGFAGAAGIVIARAVARDHFSGLQLTQFFAMLMLVNGAAPVLAPVLGGQVLRFTSWHGVFVVLGAFGVAILCGVMFGLPESLPRARRSAGGIAYTTATMWRLLTDSQFMGFTFTQALVSAGMFAYISGSPFVMQDIFKVSPQAFSVIFATNGIGIIIAGQVTARLASQLGEQRLLRTGVSAAAVASVVLLAVVAFHLPLYTVLPPLFVVVASVGMVNTAGTSLALHKHGQAAGSASALIGMFQMSLGALVAPLVGFAGSHNDLPMGLVIAVCDLFAACCYVAMVQKRHVRSRESIDM